ncbi:hypothetical protein Q9L58_008916 [Maublancomyces gigas]|uniref:DUF7587 domain-containing protein n=1 Tax=Discina gigas TaxID=1032678 RepID=A0ABR3G8R3_9PEZI
MESIEHASPHPTATPNTQAPASKMATPSANASPPVSEPARRGMWECVVCERSIAGREMTKHLAGKPHLKKLETQKRANEKAAEEQRVKEVLRKRAEESERRRAEEAAAMRVRDVPTLPAVTPGELNGTGRGSAKQVTWECEVCGRSMRRESRKSHLRGAPHLKQQARWEAQKQVKDEAAPRRVEEGQIREQKAKEEVMRAQRERAEVANRELEGRMAEKLLIEQERECAKRAEKERRIKQIQIEKEIQRTEEEERKRLEEVRVREEIREKELKRVERERLEEERRMAEKLWMEREEEKMKREAEAKEVQRREQIRIEEEKRVQEQKRVEQRRLTEEKRETELKRIETERLDQEDREEELRQAEKFFLELENRRKEMIKKEEEEAEEVRKIEQTRFEEEIQRKEEQEFQEQELQREKEREEDRRVAEQERIEVENYWKEAENQEFNIRLAREQEELIRKAEQNSSAPHRGSSGRPIESSIVATGLLQQVGASMQNSAECAANDSGYKAKMFQYLQSQGILLEEGAGGMGTMEGIYEQEQAVRDYGHISTMPTLVTSITDLPPILYRVYDDTSVSKYTWQGFDSGVRRMPRDASQFKSMVQRHGNWSSRKGTPFVSVTSSPDAAGWHVAKKQASGNDSNVMVALIDTVALLGTCKTSVWKMHDAMDHFGLEPWKGDRRAYENEYICALKIPARAIFACCQPDYFMDTALAFLKSLEWREGGKARSQRQTVLTIRAPDPVDV